MGCSESMQNAAEGQVDQDCKDDRGRGRGKSKNKKDDKENLIKVRKAKDVSACQDDNKFINSIVTTNSKKIVTLGKQIEVEEDRGEEVRGDVRNSDAAAPLLIITKQQSVNKLQGDHSALRKKDRRRQQQSRFSQMQRQQTRKVQFVEEMGSSESNTIYLKR